MRHCVLTHKAVLRMQWVYCCAEARMLFGSLLARLTAQATSGASKAPSIQPHTFFLFMCCSPLAVAKGNSGCKFVINCGLLVSSRRRAHALLSPLHGHCSAQLVSMIAHQWHIQQRERLLTYAEACGGVRRSRRDAHRSTAQGGSHMRQR
jgi:hypothetical protein